MIAWNKETQEHKNLTTIQGANLEGVDEVSKSLDFGNLRFQMQILTRMNTVVMNEDSSFMITIGWRLAPY